MPWEPAESPSEFRFQIEKGVPLPPAARRGNTCGSYRRFLYPFQWMEVGDSFFVPAEAGRSPWDTAHNINASAKSAKARHGWKRRFCTRQDHEMGGVRCWRVEDEP